MASGSLPCFMVLSNDDDVPGPKFQREPEEYTVGQLRRRLKCRGLKLSGKRDELLKRVSATVSKAGIITRSIQVSTMANSSQQEFSKKMQSYKQILV